MYYSHPCSYCRKVFYVYAKNRHRASSRLYAGIKKHLIDYNEDHKEYDFDDGPKIDTQEVYRALKESNHPPAGGYKIR